MVSLSLAPSRVRGSDLSRAHRTLCGFCCVIEPRPQRKAFSSVKTLTPRNMLDAEAQQELRDWAGFDTVMDSAASYSGATGEAFIAPVQNGRSAGALPAAEAAKLILNGNSSDIYQWVWPILVAVVFGGILLLLVILLSSFEGTHERAVPPTPQEPPMVRVHYARLTLMPLSAGVAYVHCPSSELPLALAHTNSVRLACWNAAD